MTWVRRDRTVQDAARQAAFWILTVCGWIYDTAAGAWLTPDGLTHVDEDEARAWATRTPLIQRHVFGPLRIQMTTEKDTRQ